MTRNDVMIMTTTNDVVTNENTNDVQNDDDAQTTRTRATTRALTNAKLTLTKTQNEKIVRVDDDHEIKIVKTSNNTLRIDHSLCDHESNRNAREICRKRVANMNKK